MKKIFFHFEFSFFSVKFDCFSLPNKYMYALNRIQIIGFITENPELRQLQSGVSVIDLNIKSSGKVTKEDGSTIIISSYHNVTLWRKMAEIAGDYCKAGSQVFISGRIKTDSWEGENGQKRYKTKIVAEDLILLDSRKAPEEIPETSQLSGGINTAEVIGNATKEPELRQTTSGQSVATLSVATNRKWNDRESGQQKEETEFHNIVVWGKLAEEVSETLKSGQKLYVRGRLQTRSWDTPDGEKRYTTEIIADEILLLGMKNQEFAAADGVAAAAVAPAVATATPPPMSISPKTNTTPEAESIPEIPEIKYESDIKPEDLPF